MLLELLLSLTLIFCLIFSLTLPLSKFLRFQVQPMYVPPSKEPNSFLNLYGPLGDHIWVDELTFLPQITVKGGDSVVFVVPDIDFLLEHHVAPASK